jgi:hypothetical protein
MGVFILPILSRRQLLFDPLELAGFLIWGS